MTYKQFSREVFAQIKKYPSNWRFGQKIFNAIEELYGVARAVQFEDGIDCFYNDAIVPEFIARAFIRLNNEDT